MNGRPWTAEEIALVRRRYHGRNGVELARILGRSASAVRNQAHLMGLGTPQRRVDLGHFRKLHGQGMTDAELAAAFGRTCDWARYWRAKLRLPRHRRKHLTVQQVLRVLHRNGYAVDVKRGKVWRITG